MSNNQTTTSSHSNLTLSMLVNSSNQDIKYLLYLETVKRFKDEEANITKQAEEKTRQYQEVKLEYLKLYTKYADLITKAATRAVLDGANYLEGCSIDRAKRNIELIKSKTNKNMVTECIKPELLEQFKENLKLCRPHTKLQQLQKDLIELKTNVKAIQTAMETVENTVETASLQGLDYFVDEMELHGVDSATP